MKALTVKQPWAWAIIHGGKDVENRSRPTKYRGPLFIHAGVAEAKEARTWPAFRAASRHHGINPDDPTIGMPRGSVIGTVDVIDCHHSDDCRNKNYCSEWAMPGYYHWELANPQPLDCPRPAKGMLGIWNLPAEWPVGDAAGGAVGAGGVQVAVEGAREELRPQIETEGVHA